MEQRRGQRRSPLLFWLLVTLLAPDAFGGVGSEVIVRFVKTPRPFSAFDYAAFVFEVLDEEDGAACRRCAISCKLDGNFSNCDSGQVFYRGLGDGEHVFEACGSGSRGRQCASYNWTVDTVAPTANVSVPTPFTNDSKVPVRILFSEPCTGGGGFRCSPEYCSLLVYGAGHVISSTLKTIQAELEFSVQVGISTDIQYGRLLLVMDKDFCIDAAGNQFRRTLTSSYFLRFDRRQVFVNIRTKIPEKLLQFNGNLRRIEATNRKRNLRIYLQFSEPVLNSSVEMLRVLHVNAGVLLPSNGSTLGQRRFCFKVTGISSMNVITINFAASSILSRQETPVSAVDPVTFLYDAQRPSVMLSTAADTRTRKRSIPIIINFAKPVIEFTASSLLISGGHLLSFREVSWSIYTGIIHADESVISVEIHENITKDVAGNMNLASNRLQVRHYSVPIYSEAVSIIATAAFAATSLVAAFLTVSTASLLSSGIFSRPTTYLISEPTKNLMRIACHIQVFALSKWLAANMPIEYYEFARGLMWSIPYINLPWENENTNSLSKDPSLTVATNRKISEGHELNIFSHVTSMDVGLENALNGEPLTPMEYRLFLENQNMKPEAEFLMISRSTDMWKYFGRNMFWLAIIGGGFMALHAIIFLILRLRNRRVEKKKEIGALAFPRFEIFLLLLALPSICQASSTLIRGRSTAGVAVGILLLCTAATLLVCLLLFLSIGITLGKLLQYKEVHQEVKVFHWYHELIRASLGPGKRGQWTWKEQSSSDNLVRFGPLFEDLRGPPKYMLSQISGGADGDGKGMTGDRIIASEDENEDAEATFVQKLFGILRIYYTFIESAKRVSLGIIAGAFPNKMSSRIPAVVVLSITSFQLIFLVLKKPFIKKKVQLVEIISVTCEVGVLGSCLAFPENEFSDEGPRHLGYFMLALFVLSFSVQMMNEWCALYKQTVALSSGGKSFCLGLKAAVTGLLFLLLPLSALKEGRRNLSQLRARERAAGSREAQASGHG
ncbi:hypothetical protein HPP92_020270 [Vanilla planifolia]|uniref:Bacterial Ig-like domain-containing protein n=2 Tax=Vanilla planifolia TaxID=51239 RepID=A0A835ULW9_VANPL|nr:hypothetical protein HPP92_020270 [Vanilla planifolia]